MKKVVPKIFEAAKQKALNEYYKSKKRKRMATKKKKPDKVTLAIKIVKATVCKNTVLPILEAVHLTGETMEATDLETVVSIPFRSDVTGICVSSSKLLDALTLMDDPVIQQHKPTRAPEPFFVCNGKRYRGTEETYHDLYGDKYPDWKKPDEESSEEEKAKWRTWEQYVEEYCSVLEGEPELIELPALGVDIISGKRKIKLTGEPTMNWPRYPLEDDFFQIGEITEQLFAKMKIAAQFVSNDDLRPAMTGLFFGKDLAATDAHRLYRHKMDEPLMESFILPIKAFKILNVIGGSWKIFANSGFETKDGKVVFKQPTKVELVTPTHFLVDDRCYEGTKEEAEASFKLREDEYGPYSFAEWCADALDACDLEKKEVMVPDLDRAPEPVKKPANHVAFINEDGILIITRLIDARYPQYEVVIPADDAKSQLIWETPWMRNELKLASKFANKSTHQVNFNLNGETHIHSEDIDEGHEYDNILEGAEHKGECFCIAFNCTFLDEILANLPNDQPLVMNMWSPNKCAIINDEFLLMPLMLNE